jgi:curved DNA-binding protein CbpA
MEDHYATLGVQPTASKGEISKAYKKKALALHPDKNLDKKGKFIAAYTEAFQKVNQAWDVLKDDKPGRSTID